MALPRKHRLKGHRCFDHLYRQGSRFQTDLMLLRLVEASADLLPPPLRRDPTSPWRCGVVISGKVSKRAVVRNRLRRWLHHHLCSQAPTPPVPVWLLLSLRPGSADAPRDRLLGECTDLLRKAGLVP